MANKGTRRHFNIKVRAESSQEIKGAWQNLDKLSLFIHYTGAGCGSVCQQALSLKNLPVGLHFYSFLGEINSWGVCQSHYYLLPFIVIFPIALTVIMARKQITSKLCSIEQPFILLMDSLGQDVNKHSGDGLSQFYDVWGPH